MPPLCNPIIVFDLFVCRGNTVWRQPPYFVTQLFATPSLKECVKVEVQSPGDVLDVTAKRGEDGKLYRFRW